MGFLRSIYNNISYNLSYNGVIKLKMAAAYPSRRRQDDLYPTGGGRYICNGIPYDSGSGPYGGMFSYRQLPASPEDEQKMAVEQERIRLNIANMERQRELNRIENEARMQRTKAKWREDTRIFNEQKERNLRDREARVSEVFKGVGSFVGNRKICAKVDSHDELNEKCRQVVRIIFGSSRIFIVPFERMIPTVKQKFSDYTAVYECMVTVDGEESTQALGELAMKVLKDSTHGERVHTLIISELCFQRLCYESMWLRYEFPGEKFALSFITLPELRSKIPTPMRCEYFPQAHSLPLGYVDLDHSPCCVGTVLGCDVNCCAIL